MIKKLSVLAAGMLVAASAQAAFVNGSLSFNGFFDVLPAAPSASIVSAMPPVVPSPAALAGGATDDFANGAAVAFPFLPPSVPFTLFTSGGFTFTVTSVEEVVPTALSCVDTNCVDSILFDFIGVVTGNNFQPTGFNGNWTGNGSCQGSGGECVSAISGSWSASLTATGEGTAPEPGTLALLGLGLAGLGIARRRKA